MEQVTVTIAADGLKAIVDIYYLPPLLSILDSSYPRPATQTSKVWVIGSEHPEHVKGNIWNVLDDY